MSNLIDTLYFFQVECETVVDAGVALLRAPPSALKNFRVIGVISNVLLVVDTATEGSFVIKVRLDGIHCHLCSFPFLTINLLLHW